MHKISLMIYSSLIVIVSIALVIYRIGSGNEVHSTAEGMASMRYAASFEDDVNVRVNDSIASCFLPFTIKKTVEMSFLRKSTRSLLSRKLPGVYEYAVARTQFIDGTINSLLHQYGIRQLILIGAGFDTRAHRMYEIRQQAVRVFEFDLPALQQEKQRRLNNCHEWKHSLYTNVVYNEINLNTSNVIESFKNSGIDPSLPSILILEGVSMYLEQNVFLHLLKYIEEFFQPSKLDSTGKILFPSLFFIFDYMEEDAIINDGVNASKYYGSKEMYDYLVKSGEPLKFGSTPSKMKELLSHHKFKILEVVDTEQMIIHYLTKSNGGSIGMPHHDSYFCLAQRSL